MWTKLGKLDGEATFHLSLLSAGIDLEKIVWTKAIETGIILFIDQVTAVVFVK